MKEHYYSIKHAESFIGGWYSKNTHVCDQLVECYNSNPHLWDEDKKFTDRGYKPLSTFHVPTEILNNYFDYILKPTLEKYKKKYTACSKHTIPWNYEWPFNIQRFQPGDSYSQWHCENDGKVDGRIHRRHLVFMTYLNDVTIGGETEFFYQKIKIKPRKGLTLIWPAHWTHLHRGCVSKSQEKYIVTGWFDFFDEKAGF